jgi:hypothetical protein
VLPIIICDFSIKNEPARETFTLETWKHKQQKILKWELFTFFDKLREIIKVNVLKDKGVKTLYLNQAADYITFLTKKKNL